MGKNKKIDDVILRLENHLECWKQFNHYLNLARSKKFSEEDETQFLEIKSVLTQELELILSMMEVPSPSKEEVHSLIRGAPSLRSISEMNEGAMRNLENQWHKVYISWQSLLGQLKAHQRTSEKKGFWGSLFGGK